MSAEILNIKRQNGVAGQYAYTVKVQYEDEEPMTVNFYGNSYGDASIIMEMGGNPQTQTYVSDPYRFGPKLDESWVRNFFATTASRKTALIYGDLPRGNASMACANEDCPEFAMPYSANQSDYFWANPGDTVVCSECGEPMQLVEAGYSVEFLGKRKTALTDATGLPVAFGADELGMPFYPTPCCGASGKGSTNSETGVVCRACYREVDEIYGMVPDVPWVSGIDGRRFQGPFPVEDAADLRSIKQVTATASRKLAYDPDLAGLGDLFQRQIENMPPPEDRAETLPCPEHGDESEKGGTYASFPSAYTEYHCPEGHTFAVKPGTTREDMQAEGARKTALKVGDRVEGGVVTKVMRELGGNAYFVQWDGQTWEEGPFSLEELRTARKTAASTEAVRRTPIRGLIDMTLAKTARLETCRNCGATIDTSLGAEAPTGEYHEGTPDDPRPPGETDDLCDVCEYGD